MSTYSERVKQNIKTQKGYERKWCEATQLNTFINLIILEHERNVSERMRSHNLRWLKWIVDNTAPQSFYRFMIKDDALHNNLVAQMVSIWSDLQFVLRTWILHSGEAGNMVDYALCKIPDWMYNYW